MKKKKSSLKLFNYQNFKSLKIETLISDVHTWDSNSKGEIRQLETKRHKIQI